MKFYGLSLILWYICSSIVPSPVYLIFCFYLCSTRFLLISKYIVSFIYIFAQLSIWLFLYHYLSFLICIFAHLLFLLSIFWYLGSFICFHSSFFRTTGEYHVSQKKTLHVFKSLFFDVIWSKYYKILRGCSGIIF